MHGRVEDWIQGFERKSKEETTRKPRGRWEGKEIMDLREIGLSTMDWLQLAQSRKGYC